MLSVSSVLGEDSICEQRPKNSTSPVLAGAAQSHSVSPTLFACSHWHCIVFMWVLAAAVAARRLLPKRLERKSGFI